MDSISGVGLVPDMAGSKSEPRCNMVMGDVDRLRDLVCILMAT